MTQASSFNVLTDNPRCIAATQNAHAYGVPPLSSRAQAPRPHSRVPSSQPPRRGFPRSLTSSVLTGCRVSEEVSS